MQDRETPAIRSLTFRTRGGVVVHRRTRALSAGTPLALDAALVVETRGPLLEVRALHGRGLVLLPVVARALGGALYSDRVRLSLSAQVEPLSAQVEPPLPAAVRALREQLFDASADPELALYSAEEPSAELRLFVPERVVVVEGGALLEHAYDFVVHGVSTEALPRSAGELLAYKRPRAALSPTTTAATTEARAGL